MPTIAIRTADGKPLDARVDIEGNAVVVHSRSGGGATARNPDYRAALESVLSRLAATGLKPDVFLDSSRVDHLPLAERRLVSGPQLSGTIPAQFDQIVRAMNANRPSNGAWSKVRLIVPPAKTTNLASILAGTLSPPSANDERRRIEVRVRRRVGLTAEQQNLVEPAHIDAAVARLLSGEDAPNFAPSRDYDLLTPTGDRLAPKKVFGRALEEAGVVANADPYDFSAGWTQPSFRLLQAAGYSIMAKDEAAAEAARRKRRAAADQREVDRQVATVGVDTEERRWIEGDQRMATHLRIERKRSAKAAAAKRAAVRAANDGRLACEHCPTDWYAAYPPTIAEAIFDVHHIKPLALMDEGHETRLEDLLCLCANCHRAEHRRLATKE